MDILRSIIRIIGSLLGCFRLQADRKTLISDEPINNLREDSWISEYNLTTLFLSQEIGGCSSDSTTYQHIGATKELQDEAKFLEACGTLLETPVEIREVRSPSHGGEFEPSDSHSLLPTSPIKELKWEEEQHDCVPPSHGGEFEPSHSLLRTSPMKELKWEEAQPDCVPGTAAKPCEELRTESDSAPQHTPNRCLISEEKEATGTEGDEAVETGPNHHIENYISAATPSIATSRKNKFVRFEVQPDKEPNSSRSFLSKTGAQNSEQYDSSESDNGSSKSSYPTPSLITDEMQTPGTIYPSNQKNLTNAMIRSQYVRTTWKSLKKEDLNTQQQLGQHENANPEHTLVSGDVFGGRLQSRPGEMDDRPILGVIASNWNYDEEPCQVSDKLLVWNGIPNTTRKYKEDQKISWHATPFEERLEKALSEETLISQRKLFNGKPIAFDENEECFST